MRYLKIKNSKGYYWDGSECQEIDKINKEGLLVLLNAAETDDFEMDPYDENLLGNKAHQVIYQNIYLKFKQFLDEKDQFKTEVDNLYKDAISKYSANIKDENLDEIDDLESEDGEEEGDSDEIPF